MIMISRGASSAARLGGSLPDIAPRDGASMAGGEWPAGRSWPAVPGEGASGRRGASGEASRRQRMAAWTARACEMPCGADRRKPHHIRSDAHVPDHRPRITWRLGHWIRTVSRHCGWHDPRRAHHRAVRAGVALPIACQHATGGTTTSAYGSPMLRALERRLRRLRVTSAMVSSSPERGRSAVAAPTPRCAQ